MTHSEVVVMKRVGGSPLRLAQAESLRVLWACEDAGHEVSVRGGKLVVRPNGRLDSSLRKRISENKDQLVRLVCYCEQWWARPLMV